MNIYNDEQISHIHHHHRPLSPAQIGPAPCLKCGGQDLHGFSHLPRQQLQNLQGLSSIHAEGNIVIAFHRPNRSILLQFQSHSFWD